MGSPTHSTGLHPIQLVPKQCFLQISQYWWLKSKKIKKQYPFIFKFCFLQDFLYQVNWSPTHSTGPQTVFFLQISQYRSLKSKKLKKLGPFIFKFCFWQDFPHPFIWSPTHSTGPQTVFFFQISQ